MIEKLSKRDFTLLPGKAENDEMMDAVIENLVMLGEELESSSVSKEYFQAIFNSVPDIVLITDKDGKILTSNKALCAIAENKPEVDDSSFFNDFFSGEKGAEPFTFLRKGVTKNKLKLNVKLLLNKDKQRVFSCNFGRLMSDDKDVKYLALITDITELEESRKQLTSTAIKYRLLFDNSSDGIFLFDRNGFISEINVVGQKLLDLSGSKWKGRSVDDLFSFYDHKEISLLGLASTAEAVKNLEVQVKGLLSDCLLSCTPLFAGNNHIGYQAIIKDISVYKEYNARMMRSIEEHQERERKRIAADLHDSIGQQLSGIKFMINSIMENGLFKGKAELLEQMNTDVYRIIEELRQICFDLMPGTLEKFGLVKTLEEHFHKLRKVNSKIEFKFIFQKQFPRLRREMEVSIYRIVQEFVNNSLKYAQCRTIEVDIMADKGFLSLSLKDDGKGIVRVARKRRGMGMGNIESRVTAFKGTLNISTSKETGTHFLIKIPLTTYEYY